MPTLSAPNVPAIAFPYPGCGPYVRLRPDTPMRGREGRSRKYESPSGVPTAIYVPTDVNPAIKDSSVELYFCEGEKKTLIACQEGLAAVGAPGVHCFHDTAARQRAKKRGEDDLRLHPQLMHLIKPAEENGPKRRGTIVFDSDIDRNQTVQHAAATLVTMIRESGGTPSITFINTSDDAKLGLDDLFVRLGKDGQRLRAELDDAKRPCDPHQLLQWTAGRWSGWEPVVQQRELRRAVWLVQRTTRRDECGRWLNDAKALLKVTKKRLKDLADENRRSDFEEEEEVEDQADAWMSAPGYSVRGDARGAGVWKLGPDGDGERIAHQPINVVEILTDENGTKYETLRFRFGDSEIRRTVRRGVVAGKELQALSDYGAPVTGPTCAALQMFLQAQEQANFDRLGHLSAFTQPGWSRDLDRFVLGPHVIGGAGRSLVEADSQYHSALEPGGDERIHRELIREAREASVFGALGEAAGVGAVLIRLLGVRSLLVSIWGKSLGGKSASQAVAVSHFGKPEQQKVTGNCTPTALEGALKRSRDLPLWFDDTQQTHSRELLETIAYQVGAGVGKGRGTPSGELRPLGNWLSLAMVSGEKPLLRLGVAQGARNRTLEFPFKAFKEATFPIRMHQELAVHYGHTGRRLITSLIERVIRVGKLESLRSVYSEMATCITESRSEKGDQIALLAMGAFASRVFVFDESHRDALDAAIAFGKELHTIMDSGADANVDRITAGYEAIWAFICEHPDEFGGNSRDPRQRYGTKVQATEDEYRQKVVYALLGAPLKGWAKENQYDLDEVIHGLRDRGKLIEGELDKGSRRLQKRTPDLGGARAYWIVFDDADVPNAF